MTISCLGGRLGGDGPRRRTIALSERPCLVSPRVALCGGHRQEDPVMQDPRVSRRRLMQLARHGRGRPRRLRARPAGGRGPGGGSGAPRSRRDPARSPRRQSAVRGRASRGAAAEAGGVRHPGRRPNAGRRHRGLCRLARRARDPVRPGGRGPVRDPGRGQCREQGRRRRQGQHRVRRRGARRAAHPGARSHPVRRREGGAPAPRRQGRAARRHRGAGRRDQARGGRGQGQAGRIRSTMRSRPMSWPASRGSRRCRPSWRPRSSGGR